MRTEAFEKISEKIKKTPAVWELYNALYFLCKEETDIDTKWAMCKRLRFICNAEVANKNPLSEKLNNLYKETLLLEAQFKRFDSYMLYLELNREPSKRFWLPRREQLLPVADAIQDLIDDKLDILTISLPPGSGKSTLEIFLHSMLIGANPDSPSLASGHSNILTNSIYEGVLGIINDKEEYLWHDVYPDWKDPITNAKEQTIDLNKRHRFSSLTCRAIGASLTGATRCEQILTADDLVSGIEEALSMERLDKLWQAYTNDLKSRKKLGCKELHLATRWSVHDPIGRLERMYGDNPRFKCLVIPALNEKGESNFNYKYGVGFDTQYFEDMRENLDDCSFRALFMNEPIEREGLVYDETELRRYFELPDEEPEVIIAVCDTKDKGTDYCVQIVGYKYGDNYYIDDVICDNNLPEMVDGRLIECLLRNNVQMANYESNNAGGRVAKDVQQAIKDRGGRTKITTKFTTANKETKIIVNSAWVKEHCLFKAKEKYNKQSDYGRFISMLCSYTMAGKNKNDDVPDAVSMFAEYAQSFVQRRVEVFKRFI
jgi:predicted phage terminase large subunit-like protein